MPEYKDYGLVGGQPVKISPFDTAEAGEGVHYAKDGCAFNPVIVSSSGGNPNSVETIDGTLANPWGDVDFSDLRRELGRKEATLILSSGGSGMNGSVQGLGIIFGSCYFTGASAQSPAVAASIFYDETSALDYAKLLSGSSYVDLPSATPCTLTIIYHPLPTGE